MSTTTKRKQRTIKPTPRQRRAAQITAEIGGNSKKEIVALAGYGKEVQHNPAKALETKGYKAALAEYGLTEQFITAALVEDIEAKPHKRVAELQLGADILGMRKRDEAAAKVLIVNISQQAATKYAIQPTEPSQGTNREH